MIDQLARLDEEHLLFLASMAALILFAITTTTCMVIAQVRVYRQRQMELGFWDEMLRRGLSVAEIARILSGSRPTWSQSVASLGDWAVSRASRAANRLADLTGPLFERGRSMLHPVFNRGSRLVRRTWDSAATGCRRLWRESRPLLQGAKQKLGHCMRWAGSQMDNLARRLAPPQP